MVKESTLELEPKIVLQVLKGSEILGEVYQALADQAFAPSVDEPIGEGEVVIGAMSPLEKAFFSVYMRTGEQLHAMLEKDEAAIKTCDGDCEHCQIVDHNLIVKLQGYGRINQKLLWHSIRNRLGSNAGKIMGLRAGYQIVRMPPEKIPAGMSGAIIIRGPEDLARALRMLEGSD